MIEYLDPRTYEFCERCRCKTVHAPDEQTGERRCSSHDVEPEAQGESGGQFEAE